MVKDTLRDIYDAVDDFSKGMSRRRITTYSAACAYYLFMSLIPMVMLLVSVIQYTPITQDMILAQLADYVPDQLYTLLESIISSIYSGGRVALTISILLTIWSAAASMKALMRGMDSVYDAERHEDFFVFSLRACIYMVVFILMLLLSLFAMVYGGQILQLLYNVLPHGGAIDWLFGMMRYMRFAVVLAVLALAFSITYWRMPARRLSYKAQWPGAAFCAVSWSVFSVIFSFYVSVSNRFGAYGVIGTVIVAMMWLYYCFYFLLLGGYINHYIAQRRAERRITGA